jgi:hypothetical protein
MYHELRKVGTSSRQFTHFPFAAKRARAAILNGLHAAKMACFDDKESDGAGTASSSFKN